jgi:hypothetical protein
MMHLEMLPAWPAPKSTFVSGTSFAPNQPSAELRWRILAMLHLECCIGGLPQLVHQVRRVLLQQLLHGRLVKAL